MASGSNLIRFFCEACGDGPYQTDPANIGKKIIRCKKCGEISLITSIAKHKDKVLEAEPLPKKQRFTPLQRAFVVLLSLLTMIFVTFLVSSMRSTLPTTQPVPALSKVNTGNSSQPTQPKVIRSLANGTNVFKPVGISGRAKLTVENGTDEDAFVIVQGDGTLRGTYVQKHRSAEIRNIGQCVCEVLFVTGTDWDGWDSATPFTMNLDAEKFEHLFNFSETYSRDESGITTHWIDHSVSLQPVPNGTIRLTNIRVEEFRQALNKLKEVQGQ